MFLNREKELQTLNAEFQKNSSAMSVIYGRRRVGKTALISQYIQDKPHIYFYATSSDLKQQYEQLSQQVLKLFDVKHSHRISLNTFEEIIDFIVEEMEEKIVFVIDEFQNLCYLDKSFSSNLQKIWDMKLEKTDIHIILCGSVLSMMHSEVLDQTAPLYGRRTSNIHLRPLSFKYIADFLPDISKEDQINIYASFGTIPKYLQAYDKNLSFKENIKQNILNKDSYLYSEGQFLLKLEINEVGTYFGIIEAISKGNTKIGDIASILGVHSSYLPRYLQKLIDLDILIKEVPITEKDPRKSKMGRYRIKDKFLNFWFYYVYKNYQHLEIGQDQAVLDEIEINFNDRFVAFAFEDYIQELILMDPIKHIGFVPTKIGRWWTNKEEIDLIAFNDTQIAYIECKWRNSVNKEKVKSQLVRKSTLIDSSNKDESYFVFTKEEYLNSKL
jgi:AAA+ ATPase superfamily predicted ATPase